MHQIFSQSHTEQSQTNLDVSGNGRKSEIAGDLANKAKDQGIHVPVDEVRLSAAVRKIMASASGPVTNQSAALLASKIASSDPALANQAFGRIISAVTFSLLSPGDHFTSPPDDLVLGESESEEPALFPDTSDISPLPLSSDTAVKN